MNGTKTADKENVKNGHTIRSASSDNDLTLVEDEPAPYKGSQ